MTPRIVGSPGISLPLFVDRDRERTVLSDLFAATRNGQGRLVLISGEAGIGKTALANAFSSEATASGACVLVGRCYDRTETSPFGLWSDLFTRYEGTGNLPTLPPVFAERGTLGPVTSQAMLFNQVLDFVRAVAMQQPLVLILDDIHWSDPASLDLLRTLARWCTALPLLLVATYRLDEVIGDHPLTTAIPLLVRESDAIRLDLRRLDQDALKAYVTGRYVLPEGETTVFARYLHDRSDGNPFFIIELLRALEEDQVLRRREDGWAVGSLPHTGVPLLLRQVIEARLARLGKSAHHLLAVGAVIGQEISLTLWQEVSGVDEEILLDVVERAIAAHVLEQMPDGMGVTFVHTLIGPYSDTF